MSPLLSISIITFYLSLLISLFLYFQLIKKNKIYEELGIAGVLVSFMIGSLLLIDTYALKIAVSSLVLIIYGLIVDRNQKYLNILSIILTTFISSIVLFFIMALPFKTILFTFILSTILNTTVKPHKFLPLIYTFAFALLTLYYNHLNGLEFIKASLLLTVSTSSLIFLSFPKPKIKLGFSGTFVLNFFLTVFLVNPLMKF